MIKKQKISLFLALFFLILAGAFFRLYHLGSQSYWMDEGYTVNAVDSEIRNGTAHFASILDSGKTYFCPLYCAPTAGMVSVFGHDTSSYRILSAVFGIGFIVLVYFLTQIFFQNLAVSVLASFFASFSYWQIAWSRQARWYTELEVFFWGALLVFYLFLQATEQRKKYLYLGASLGVTFLAMATHKIALLLPVIFIVWYFVQNPPSKKQLWFGIPIFVIFVLSAKHFFDLQFHYTLPYYLNFYVRNYWMFLLCAVYGYFSIPKEVQRKFLMLAAPCILTLTFFSFFTDVVHYRYLFHTTVAMYILGAAGVIHTITQIKNKRLWRYAIFAIILIFFLSGQGVSTPRAFYFLEADNPKHLNRPYYAYTPQPDFNAAYGTIRADMKTEDIVISSHPHFNKIFLDKAGYWLKYNYLGMEDGGKNVDDGKEYYVGASVINNLDELRQLTSAHHGYIIYDYMATDGKIPTETIQYIQTNFKLFFFDEKNSYSKIWVYQF